MIRSAASKIMWVGRATVFLLGVAVILALLFGAASTVEAHTGNKGFFHLGHRNVSQAVSKLVKKGAGPALNLKVGSGPPLAVNSSTKVNNLNADKLDGKDSRTIGVNGRQVVRHTSAWNSEYYKLADAHCPPGKIVIGTGFDIQGSLDSVTQDTDVVILGVDQRSGPDSEYVRVRAAEEESTGSPWYVQAIAICASAP